MQLNEYQAQALTTCLPTALSREYLIPGIVAEVGELFGKDAKAVRDGWTPERLQAERSAEYGDVGWMTAVLLHVEGVHTTAGVMHTTRAMTFTRHTGNPGQALLARISALMSWHVDSDLGCYVASEAQQLWLDLRFYCRAVTGEDFDAVLAANLVKLTSRLQRGTLQGSGDAR
jgi:hypothetical protein